MASEDVQTNLRLPADLKDRLQSSASENNRSLSAEVASRLEASYRSSEGLVTKAEFEDSLRRAALRFESEQIMSAGIRTMLANNVIRLFEQLEPERRTDALADAYDFAKSLTGRGTPGLEEAVAKIMRVESIDPQASKLASALREQESFFDSVVHAENLKKKATKPA